MNRNLRGNMKIKKIFLLILLTCIYSIAYAWTATDVKAESSISGIVSGPLFHSGFSINLNRIGGICGETSTVTEETLRVTGFFLFSNVENGLYFVTPETHYVDNNGSYNYTFSPKYRLVTIRDNWVNEVNFTSSVD
jgi:hypothetical protein